MFRRRKRTSFALLFALLVFYLFVRSRPSTPPWSIWREIHRDDDLFITPSSCSTEKNVRRAILVHFPVQRASHFLPELKWLYLSWVETIRRQPAHWATDLLVYSLPSSLLDQLGCSSIEERSERKNQCVRVQYHSLWNRSNETLSRLVQQHVPGWCRHLDSLAILLEPSDHLDRYDYVLRTDLDVFLTPHFARYIPEDCSFQVGLGSYTLDYTWQKLSRIAQTLQLSNGNLREIGSTWYAPPRHAVLVARLALWLSVWLSENEFTRLEKDQQLSILSWPQWYIGVVSMYASHLAINHFASRRQINLIQKPYLIDYSCTKNISFDEEEIIHIHAWHTSEIFSKFLFKNGSYDHLFNSRTVWNTNYSLDYLLDISLRSQRMSLKELFDMREDKSL